MPYAIPPPRLAAMLLEDAPHGDMTTSGLGIGHAPASMVFKSGSAMTVCCIEEAEEVVRLAGCRLIWRYVASGDNVGKDTILLRAEGTAAQMLVAARTAQVLVEIASGIATRARRIVAAARAARPGIGVACTRKHLPGAKDIMLKAAIAGGCTVHRFGLSESMLVFDHHRAFLAEPQAAWIARLRAAQPERRVVVEAHTMEDALVFAQAGADSVQLDRVSPEEVARFVEAVSVLPRRPGIVATGGINEANAAAYAEAGPDMIVTSAPYAAPPLDVKVAIMPLSIDNNTGES